MRPVGNAIRLLIIQERLTHYRVELFNRLAQTDNLAVTVAHGGCRVGSGHAFEELILPHVSVAGFRWLRGGLECGRVNDVVIAPFDLRFLTSAARLQKSRLKNVILWGHGFGRSRAAVPVRRMMARKAGALLVYGDAARDAIASRGIKKEKIFVAHNTLYVPNSAFDATIERKHFLFVGRLQSRKRVDELISAFAWLMGRIANDINLVIVGGGPLLGELKRRASELQVADRVVFLGPILDADKLKHIFQRAIAYVSPGAVGLGLLHAFAYGVPVVTNRDVAHGPEYENLVEGRNGLLYSGDAKALSHLLGQFAMSPELSYRMGAEAFSHYAKFRSMDRMTTAFCQAVSHVVEQQIAS